MENQIIESEKKIYQRWWFWVLVVIFVITIVNIAGGGQNGGSTASDNSSVTRTPQGICDIDSSTLAKQLEKVDYKQLNKEPDSFTGKIATFTGQILQIQQSGNEGVIRLSVTNEGYGFWSPNDVIFVTYHQPTKAVEDDVVTITGKLTGSYTYTSAANYQITVPSMNICSVEIQSTKTTSTTPPAKTAPVITQPITTPTPVTSIACYTDSQCGTNSLTGSLFCQSNAVYQNYITYTCNKAGTPQSYCSNSTTQQLQQTCSSNQTCGNSTCNNISPTPTGNQNTSPASNETVSQQNAVKKAKSYLNFTAFSHDGLVAQLVYDQFSNADAVYGADNSGADWNEQAAAKAKSYMSFSAFSRGSLIAQLEYDQFTQAQAEYGVNAVGL